MKIVTMGEIMLRLSTPNNEKFIQADEFDINYGGGEANVAVSCANYGHNAEFVTAVPDNELGECAVAALRKNKPYRPLRRKARHLLSGNGRVNASLQGRL